MLPHSAYDAFQASQPDAQSALDQKAGAPTGAAAQSKAGLQSEVAALNPRAARFAQFGAAPDESDDASEPTAAVGVPNSPEPSAPSSSDSVLHPDSQVALEKLGYDDETISKLNLPQVRTIIKHQLPAKHAAPAQTSSVPADSPFAKPADPAAPILAAAPISQDLRGDAWDAYHTSKDENEFADKITPLAIPDSIKDSLWQEKRRQVAAVPVAPVDKVVAAVQKMVALPDAVLRVAESRPKLLAAYTSAATEGDAVRRAPKVYAPCPGPNCTKLGSFCRGFCSTHYLQFRKACKENGSWQNGEVLTQPIVIEHWEWEGSEDELAAMCEQQEKLRLQREREAGFGRPATETTEEHQNG